MSLRIGFDMDGTIADFEAAFHAVERRLFGPGETMRAGEPEREEAEGRAALHAPPGEPAEGRAGLHAPPGEPAEGRAGLHAPPGEPAGGRAGLSAPPGEPAEGRTGLYAPPGQPARKGPAGSGADAKDRILSARQARRRRDRVWAAIRDTPNFWETLKPLDPDAVGRIHALMLEHRWEVFFITQRPKTAGDTVQRQTQRWLVAQGFDLPSVLVLGGSRGAAAGALRLDYHVDDSAQNCLDILSDSRAKPLLVVPGGGAETLASARQLGVGTVPSITAALDILAEASAGRHEPGILTRLAALVGWR
jgi:hypothetical protein